jgi:hypothetical protein
MLNYEHSPALDAAQIAAEIADRLGLVELRANALITIGMCRYHAGEPDGLVDLQEALQYCRTFHLPSLRRATQNVAVALREEGDQVRSDRLLTEGASIGTGSGSLHTNYSLEAMQELFAGDWSRFLAVADAFLDTPTGEWDLQIRGVRAWMRALRGDVTLAEEDLAKALEVARSSGFWRLRWNALGHGALCQAVLGHSADATAMLQELFTGWRRMKTIASGEWIPAAAHAAVRLGPEAARLIHDLLDAAPHHTPWSLAALASADGATATARGDHARAGVHHLDAAARYQAIGSLTDRALALAAAAQALHRAGETANPGPNGSQPASLNQVRDEVTDFAVRNKAPALLGPPEASVAEFPAATATATAAATGTGTGTEASNRPAA